MPTATPTKLIIRRITTLTAIRNTKREIIAYRAECNHGRPTEIKMFPLSQWGSIAYEMAMDWTLNHKCNGDETIANTKEN